MKLPGRTVVGDAPTMRTVLLGHMFLIFAAPDPEGAGAMDLMNRAVPQFVSGMETRKST